MTDKESLFGITSFFDSTTSGFDGTLKNRISDFLVNEVDSDGNVVHLTKLGLSSDLLSNSTEKVFEAVKTSLDSDLYLQIEQFIQSGASILEIPAPKDKDVRRALHKSIDASFPQLIRTPKETADRERVIELALGSKQSTSVRREHETRNRFSNLDYIHCVLYKENMDTMEAVHQLGRYLGVPAQCIQYAGVKDRRAKTCQKISLRMRDPRRIARFSHPAMKVGNYSFQKTPLRLGDLSGNRFNLVIRNLVDSNEAIEARVKSFGNGGFINYFGLQRFGTTEVSTADVGKALLKSNWGGFVDLIMKPRQGDNPAVFQCRKVWAETKDAGKALVPLGHRNCVEMHLLKGLAKQHANNLSGAIQNIPRNMRTLYVHAYQSLLWNLAASHRIETYGAKPVVGDLVYSASATEQATKRAKRDQPGGESVRVLTEDELADYSIHDILLPLPGFDVEFPDNDAAKYMLDLMAADGIDLRSRHPVKDYSLPGGYRAVVAKPADFTWELRTNLLDDEQDVVQSDADFLDEKTLPAVDNDHAGVARALIIGLTLKSSVYATMAIRELQKRSSDFRAVSGNAGSGSSHDFVDGEEATQEP